MQKRFSRGAVRPETCLCSPAAGDGEERKPGAEQRRPPPGIEEGLATQQQTEHVGERRNQEQPHREVHEEWVELAGDHRVILPVAGG